MVLEYIVNATIWYVFHVHLFMFTKQDTLISSTVTYRVYWLCTICQPTLWQLSELEFNSTNLCINHKGAHITIYMVVLYNTITNSPHLPCSVGVRLGPGTLVPLPHCQHCPPPPSPHLASAQSSPPQSIPHQLHPQCEQACKWHTIMQIIWYKLEEGRAVPHTTNATICEGGNLKGKKNRSSQIASEGVN